jgi:hypothetical protein
VTLARKNGRSSETKGAFFLQAKPLKRGGTEETEDAGHIRSMTFLRSLLSSVFQSFFAQGTHAYLLLPLKTEPLFTP